MIHLAMCLTLLVGTAESAECWPSFRNGGDSRSTAKSLPINWSPDSGIAWQHELPGYGQSSPVVWNGTVFLTAVEGPMKETCLVLALDAQSGQEQWSRTFVASTTARSNSMVSRAAPTPVVDQNGLYVFFEGGDLIGLSHQGEVKWQRSLTKEYGEFSSPHGVGSSLTQSKAAVIVQMDQRGPSYLLAVDKATGQTRWKVGRESRASWTSPIVVRWQGKEQVVVSSSGMVDGYDATAGKLLWTLGGLGGNSIPSPSVAGDRLFVGAGLSRFGPVAGAAQSNCCLELREASGDYRCEVLWRAEKALAHYASPLPYRDCVYYVNKVGAVYCLDIETGRENYVHRIDGPCWATPVAVGDHIYFFGKDGVTTVIKAGPTFAKVATNALWDPDNPPKPEGYVESKREERTSGRRGGPSSDRTIKRVMSNDKNEDDRLTKDELPGPMRWLLTEADTNNDGAIDRVEVEEMLERTASRRRESRGTYYDPLVCGVAVIDDSFFIRTGTRLYCVRRQ